MSVAHLLSTSSVEILLTLSWVPSVVFMTVSDRWARYNLNPLTLTQAFLLQRLQLLNFPIMDKGPALRPKPKL